MTARPIVIIGTYDHRVVALSIVVAILASCAALDQGAGIWTMHYTGMLAFTLPVPTRYDWPYALLSVVVGLSGAVLAVWQSLEQLRALASRLERVREEERTRLARQIHDELGQALTGIRINLMALVRQAPDHALPAEKVYGLLKLIDETIQMVRRIATELRPGILDLGLVAAVEWAAEEFQARTGVTCHVSVPKTDVEIDGERATALFRILQEALTNITRHAEATEAHVRLAVEDGTLVLEIRDNGRGVDKAAAASGRSLGILGMRERAVLLGGQFSIRGRRGAGTTVSVRLPVAG